LRQLSAAGARGAGTGAAAAATAHRIGGGDGEAGPIPGVNEIHLDGATGVKQSLVHQKGQFAFLKNLVVVL